MATGQQAPLPASNIAASAAGPSSSAPAGIGDYLHINGQGDTTFANYGYATGILEVYTDHLERDVRSLGDSIALQDDGDDGVNIYIDAGLYFVEFGAAVFGDGNPATEEPAIGWGAFNFNSGSPSGPPPEFATLTPERLGHQSAHTLNKADNVGGSLRIATTLVVADVAAVFFPSVMHSNAPEGFAFASPTLRITKIG